MPSTKEELTIFGHDFFVKVDESSGKRQARDGGFFSEGSELPPCGEHVAHATHKGIQKWLHKESRERGFEKTVEDAIETTAEFWRQEFGKVEEFKQL